MQVDETLRARSTNVVELFSHSRCLRCQERNRRCHLDRGSTCCLQCDTENGCTFTRTVSRTAPASAFSWTELTGLSPSISSTDERSAFLPDPASAPQNHQSGQGFSSAKADLTHTRQTLLKTPQAWISTPSSPLPQFPSSTNGEVDEDDIAMGVSTKDGSASSHPHRKRTGPLTPMAREGARRMRISRTCVRCGIMKEKCSPETPCARCNDLLSKHRIWSMPCVRGTLAEYLPQLIPGYEAIFLTDKISSAGHVQDFEIPVNLSIDVRDTLFQKLFAVKSMSVPTKSIEDILGVVLPSGSEPIASQPSRWPNQLVQSFLDLAARLTAEISSLNEATTSNLKQPESQVLELALCNLRLILEMELVVTDADKKVDADRIRLGLRYFHNYFQDLLVVLDKLLMGLNFSAFLAKFVAVALFFLIEHSIVKVCQKLDRAFPIEHSIKTPVPQNDHAIAAINLLAGHAFRKIPGEIASKVQAHLSQLTIVDDDISGILTKLQTANTKSFTHHWQILQQRLVEGGEEQLTSGAGQNETTGLQA